MQISNHTEFFLVVFYLMVREINNNVSNYSI